MSEGSVIFKGSLNGLTIIMKEEEDYDSILKQIEDKIASSGRFFLPKNRKESFLNY